MGVPQGNFLSKRNQEKPFGRRKEALPLRRISRANSETRGTKSVSPQNEKNHQTNTATFWGGKNLLFCSFLGSSYKQNGNPPKECEQGSSLANFSDLWFLKKKKGVPSGKPWLCKGTRVSPAVCCVKILWYCNPNRNGKPEIPQLQPEPARVFFFSRGPQE